MTFKLIFVSILLIVPYVLALNPFSKTNPFSDGLGVNIHTTSPKPGEMEMMRAAGFKWVRMDFHWAATERKKGEYDFKDYEFLTSEIVKHNMSALYILDYGNTLYDKPQAVTTEEGRKAYAKWAATAVEHFRGRAILWEIWNEPNINFFWNNRTDSQQYISMALEAVKAIRAKTPAELIVGPATSQMDFIFLEQCFKAGLLEYWDAVSVHPYRIQMPETVTNDYYMLRNLIERYAPKGKSIPILSSEWGYSAKGEHVDAMGQAKYLVRQSLTNALNYIPVSIWFDWHNDSPEKNEGEVQYGTVLFDYHSGKDPVYTPKPAYLFAKTMNSVLEGYHFVKRIATPLVYDYVMLFSDGKNYRIAVWTTLKDSHKIAIPSDKCDFEIIQSKGDIHENMTSTNGGLTLTVNDSPYYVIVKGTNHALETAPNDNFFRASIMPIHGKTVVVIIHNLYASAVNGTVQLTEIKGIEPTENEIHFQMQNEFEKIISFSLKTKPNNEYTAGLQINARGSAQKFQAHRFHFSSDQLITDCAKKSNDKGPHSESVHSAPEPLFDSDSVVMKIDYHYSGSFFDMCKEKNAVTGEPKAIGNWVYGDNQMMQIKIRIRDSSQQTFQIHPETRLKIDWKGWRFVTFNLSQPETHWGGSNDGVVHYPIEFENLLLLDSKEKHDIKGAVYMTAPVIIY